MALPLCGVVALAAAHLARRHAVRVREAELTGASRCGTGSTIPRLLRIDDRALAAARLDVEAARTVARFAAVLPTLESAERDLRVRGGAKMIHGLGMAFGARLVSDKRCARYKRRSDHRAI